MKNILRNTNFGFTKWCIALVATVVTLSGVAQAQVKISQVYGAGGNFSAVYNTDYVELYNAGSTAQNLSGWSIQYASATGTSWSVQAISGTIQPGKYFLISLASGGSVGSALPTPDYAGIATGTGNINMSGTNGKVALANSTTAFSGTVPTGAVDFVGFGTASTYEGTGAAPAPSTANAIFRAGSGATDTNDNKANFSSAAAAPRNSSSGGGSSTPTITLNPTSLTGLTTTAGTASAAQTFTVTGANLSANVTVTAPTGFEVASDGATLGNTATINQSGGSASGTISVRIAAATAQGSPSGNVTLASTGATTANVAVSGTVAAAGAAAVSVTGGTLTAFSTVAGTASAAQSFTVSGSNLNSDITVTAPTGFEVSTDATSYASSKTVTQVSGTAAATTISVRIAASTAPGTLASANVTVGATDVTTANVAVSGTVTTPALTLTLNPTSVAENAGANASTGTVGIPSSLSSDLIVNLASANTAAATVPASVTITSGQTSATFSIAAVENTNSFGSKAVVITASANVYTPASATLTVLNIDPAPVLINKFENTAVDVIELLVIANGAPGATVDMRGMLIKDHSSDNASDGGGKYVFSSNSLWQAVPAGTLIVLTLDGAATDANVDGFIVRVGLNNTDYFTKGTGTMNLANTDMVMIKEAGSAEAGSVGMIHALANGASTQTQTAAAGSPKLVNNVGTAGVIYASNPNSTIADYNGSLVTQGATGTIPFGTANNPSNAAFIASLRGTKDISISIDANAVIVNEDAGVQADKITVALSVATTSDLTVNLSATPADIVNLPASVTIPAGSSSVTVGFTPINDNTSAGNRTVTIGGSADTWNSANNTVTVVDVQYTNPSVVINEVVNQTSGDVVELLVIQNNLNMAGMILKDFSGDMGGDVGGSYTFTSNSLWQSVKAGTLIVLTRDATATEDTDASDGLVTVKLTNTTYFTAGGSFDISAIDMVMIKAAGAESSGITGAIHTFGNGPAGTLFKLANGAKLLFTAGGAGGGADNATSTIGDYNGTGVTGGTATLGAANNANNQTYITALRASVNSAPTDIGLTATSIAENNVVIAIIGTLSTTDADAGDTFTYSLVAGTGDTDNSSFNISDTSLRASAAFDFETKSSYSIRVRTTDSANNTFEKAFTITVTDVVEQTAQEAYLASFGLSGVNLLGTADPDGDGMNNNAEFAFGTSPVDGSSRAVTQESVVGGIKITYLQRSGVTYTVKSATDLATGFTGTVTPLITSPQPTGLPLGYEQYEATLTGGDRGFMQVEATVP